MCDSDLPPRIDFESWINEVFDHDVNYEFPSYNPEVERWNEELDPHHAVSLLTRLWAAPEFLIDRFSRDQIGRGIRFLVDTGTSSYGLALVDPVVPLTPRLECLTAILTLYQRCFNRICLYEYSQLATSPVNEANFICCMFWDVFCMYPRSKTKPWTEQDRERQRALDDLVIEECCRKGIECDIEALRARPEPRQITVQERQEFEQIEEVCLTVMERTLELDNPACQEGALHGLGHWAYDYPERVHAIIDKYLQGNVPTELRQYASVAKTGMIQ